MNFKKSTLYAIYLQCQCDRLSRISTFAMRQKTTTTLDNENCVRPEKQKRRLLLSSSSGPKLKSRLGHSKTEIEIHTEIE